MEQKVQFPPNLIGKLFTPWYTFGFFPLPLFRGIRKMDKTKQNFVQKKSIFYL